MAPERAHPGSRLIAEVAEAERAERTRLADRLHDEGLQLVLAARQELQGARDGDPAALDALGDDLRRAGESLRSLTAAMHEDVLARLPLADALGRIGADAARRGRFAFELVVAPEATGVHDALVRDIARELLANAARHARATRVLLEVLAPDGHVLVRVTDDGRGIEPRAQAEAERAGHVGLGRLARITQELGGRFAVDGPPAGGTVAAVWLPSGALAAQQSLEDALRGERRWSAALLAALQDGLMVFRSGVVVQVNDAWIRMTGWARDAVLGTTPDDHPFWPEDQRDYLRTTVAEAYDHGGLDQVVELLRADGTVFPALCSSARIDDPAGDEIGMLVVVKDLTERRRADERRRLELELGATIETTRRLTELLDALPGGIATVLGVLGRLLVEHLGWDDAVVNLRRPDADEWDVAWTSSGALAETLAHTRSHDADWAAYLAPRYERRGASFVPSGDGPPDTLTMHVPEWEAVAGAGAWQADDLLLVPLRSPDGGALTGMLSVDRPRSGLRPTDNQLDGLVAVAAHAASVIALARRRGAGD